MIRLFVFLAALLAAGSARAQNPQCLLTPAPGTSNQLCASTAFVHNVANSGLTITQPSGGGNANDPGNFFDYNYINIPNDAQQQPGGGGTNPIGTGLMVFMQPNGAKGERTAITGFIFRTGANADTGFDTIGINGIALSNVPNNGTNLTSGAVGTLFGGSFAANALSGATNLFAVSGTEFDVSIASGASARYRFGISVVDTGGIQAADPIYDAQIELGSAGGPGFKNGILFSNVHGAAPLTTGACMICTDGSVVTVATGIDFSSYTISGNSLKFPSFSVSGAGNAIANTIALTSTTGSLIAANSSGATNLLLSGAHTFTNGINLASGTFTNSAFASPGFSVDGSGNVSGAIFSSGANTGVTCAAGISATTGRSVLGIITHC